MSRFFFRDAILSRFGSRLETVNKNLDSDGPFYLFTLRLIPAIPFFVVNLVMGLTSMRLRTFWWISQIGMLPGTIVFVLAGASVPGIEELQAKGASSILSWKVLVAFAILGVFPLIAKQLLKLFKPASKGTPTH